MIDPDLTLKKLVETIEFLNRVEAHSTTDICDAVVDLLESCEASQQISAVGSVLEEMVALVCYFHASGNKEVLEQTLTRLEVAENSRDQPFVAYELSEMQTIFKLAYSEKWLMSVLSQGDRPLQKDLVAAYPEANLGWAISRLQSQGLIYRNKVGRTFQIHPVDPSPERKRPTLKLMESIETVNPFWTELTNSDLGNLELLTPIDPDFTQHIFQLQTAAEIASSSYRSGDLALYVEDSKKFLRLWLSNEDFARALYSHVLGMGLFQDAVRCAPLLVAAWQDEIIDLSRVQRARWDEFSEPLRDAARRGAELRIQIEQQGSVLQSSLTRGLSSADADALRRVLRKMDEWGIIALFREGNTYRISMSNVQPEISHSEPTLGISPNPIPAPQLEI